MLRIYTRCILCTTSGTAPKDAIANSLPLSSWLKWKKDCAFSAKTESECFFYLRNLCLGSYLVIKTTSQVTLQYILGNLDIPGLHILHLVPMESSLPESLVSYWGKLHKLISLPFREINAKVDFCSHIKADINYVESNLSFSLDDKYMLLNVEDYKSNPRWYMMELLNFLDLYPSDYHLQQIHNAPAYQPEATKVSSVPVRTLLQVNLDGLQALKALKDLSNCWNIQFYAIWDATFDIHIYSINCLVFEWRQTQETLLNCFELHIPQAVFTLLFSIPLFICFHRLQLHRLCRFFNWCLLVI